MDIKTLATFAVLILLSIGGLYYLRRFFSERTIVAPTTGPLAGGFGRIEFFASIFLMLLLVSSTVENFGKKQIFTVPIIVQSCILYLALIVGLISLLIIRYRNPINVLGLRWTRWRRELPLALLALLSVYPIIILVQVIMQQIYGPDAAPQEIVQFLANSPGLNERLLLAFLAIVMAPLAEETIFRGFMFGTMRQFWGRWPALIISASVFALIHGHIPALPGLFILAIFLTLVYERTGSLWAPIMLHAIFNTVTVVGTIFFPSSMP